MTVIKRKQRMRSSTEKHPSLLRLGIVVLVVAGFAWRRSRPQSGLLCEECWEMVRSMPQVDVSNHDDNQEFWVVGARNEEGVLAPFYYDETELHRNPEPFAPLTSSQVETFCDESDVDYRMFHEKILVDMNYDQQKTVSETTTTRPRILCIVSAFEGDHSKIPIVRRTWGSKCDGFIVVSNKTDRSIGAIGVPHEGPDEFANKWQKVQSTWTFVYNNYYSRYDWFFLAQPDSFLLIENLRHYLESEELQYAANRHHNNNKQTPLFLGRRFALAGLQSEIFNAAGPGYVLNQAALKSLVEMAIPNLDDNLRHAQSSSHDTLLAQAFRTIGVRPYPTQDEQGGERFMPFLPHHHFAYRFPTANTGADWYAKWSLPGVRHEGADHFAARSIGFHHATADNMAKLYALAYRLCPEDD